EHAREAGLPVELRLEGTPKPLPTGVDLTAYRLVQEGLTNALKHAQAHRAEVVVRYGDGYVELAVSDDGRGVGGGDGSGHGLVGPLWFDVVAVIGFTTPLFLRRRFPLKAPLAIYVALGSISFVDRMLIPSSFVAFVAALVGLVLIGMYPERSKAVAGLVLVQ